MATAKWAALNLPAVSPEGAEDALEAVEDAMELLKDALDLMATAIGYLAATAVNTTNLAIAVIELAREALRRIVNLFVGTSFSVLGYCPRSIREVKSPSAVLRLIGESFFDGSDTERPIALTSDTGYATLVIFLTAPDINPLITQYETLRAMFTSSIEEVRRSASRELRPRKAGNMLAAYGGFPITATSRGLPRTKPDWATVRLSDVGPFGEIVKVLVGLEQRLGGASLRVQGLLRLLNLVNGKISGILLQVERIRAAIQVIAEVAILTTGASVLLITGEGNTQQQVFSILVSRYASTYPFSDREACAALVLHAQAGGVGTARVFFELMTGSGPTIPVADIATPSGRARVFGYTRATPESVIANPWRRT